ncbi:ribose ABC transporter [Belnapia sp. T18]|uniref:Ribose ABC transporter n=1 Tax=Belnapia arida TaxID=2804533 RepID=A0ABS1U4Q4_9PROT|nr:RbsD/FucU domain-containing protein [Belnapia arida]MBL6079667.1 ribose ABC transporter [Belnapia arida]
MLLGLDPLLTPDLLHALASAGHGDRIAIVDANFPAAANARRLIRLPGADAAAGLRAILSVLPIDDFEPDPALVMEVVGDPAATPEAVTDFSRLLRGAGAVPPRAVPRHDFYALAREAFAVVATGERRLYGNILLTKGVVR